MKEDRKLFEIPNWKVGDVILYQLLKKKKKT